MEEFLILVLIFFIVYTSINFWINNKLKTSDEKELLKSINNPFYQPVNFEQESIIIRGIQIEPTSSSWRVYGVNNTNKFIKTVLIDLTYLNPQNKTYVESVVIQNISKGEFNKCVTFTGVVRYGFKPIVHKFIKVDIKYIQFL